MNFFSRRQLVIATAALAFGITAAGTAFAQASFTPLRVILPVGAGSGVDTIIRASQTQLSKALGDRPVVIENMPGAGGVPGTTALVKAAADGNTIAFLSNNHAVNPSVFKKMPYDSLADITPISVVGETPFVLVVNPTRLPAKNAKELIALLKAKPDYYNFGSSGNGTIIHLATEMFIDAAEVKARHIPYKGVGPMVTDIMSGQIDFGVVAVPAVQGQLKSGMLRAIGIMGNSRVASLPDLPTMKEQGLADVVIGGWFVAVGPKGLPPAEVKKLHTAITTAFATAEVKEQMAKQDNIIHPSTPEAAAQFMKSEQARYAKLVQKADIKLD